MNNKTRFYIIDAAVFVAFTVIAFAVPFAKNGVFWLAYVFGVIAIAAQIYVYPKAFEGESARSKFYGFPIAKLSTIYLIVQLILSILCMALAKVLPTWVPAVVFILLLAAAVIGFVAAEGIRTEIERQDVKLKTDVTFMRGLQSRVRMLPARCDDAALKAELERFAEQVQYSDPVSSEAIRDAEMDLNAAVDTLQQALVDGDLPAAMQQVKQCEIALAERNRLCKVHKHG